MLGYDVARRTRPGDQRLQAAQVDLVHHVIRSIRIGGHLGEVAAATLLAQERSNLLVRREDAGGRAEFGAHVRDHVPVHGREGIEPGTVVLDDPAHAALDAVPAQHLQDDVLGAHPRRQRPGQPHPQICGIVT